MTEQKRRKTEKPGRTADIAKVAISAPAEEQTPHPAAGASTLSPRRGLDHPSHAGIAENAKPAPPNKSQAPVSDVAKLPAELRDLVERMLVEGATFEDIYDAVNERGVPVTLQAIQSRYRSDLELQKRRIQFQAERARVLTQALGDPDSSDAQLAYAAMLTGLQSLTRKDGGLSLRDAVKGTMERRNILLKRDLLKMQLAREQEDKRFRKTRLHAEILKLRLTRAKLVQLERELKKPENSSTLGRVAMEKIQEIYGLLQMPVIPRDVEVLKNSDEGAGKEIMSSEL